MPRPGRACPVRSWQSQALHPFLSTCFPVKSGTGQPGPRAATSLGEWVPWAMSFHAGTPIVCLEGAADTAPERAAQKPPPWEAQMAWPKGF